MKGKKGENEFNELEAIINDFNTRFGIDNWTDDDKIKAFLFEQLPADFAKDQATVNSVKIPTNKMQKSLLIKR
jgi:type I restriction enzyme R subunit